VGTGRVRAQKRHLCCHTYFTKEVYYESIKRELKEQRGKKTFSFLTKKKKGNKMQRVFLTMQGDPPHVAL